MKTILLATLFALPLPALASPADCSAFVGTWVSADAEAYNQLAISLSSSDLVLSYQRIGSTDGCTADFIPDGTEHAGTSVNTGSSYTASCSSDAITIVENTPELVVPLTISITLINGVLTEIDTVQGFLPQLRGHYSRQ